MAVLGKLQDPTDIPFDAELLEDATALAAAVDDLVARKPHLAVRRVAGDIGQGAGNGAAGEVSLASMLRDRA